MPHILQERYSQLVMAKLRAELMLKDGVVFNNDYEGDPKAGAVKIPKRDTEVAVSDYDKANGITGTTGATAYETMLIDKDKAVNEIIDGYDADAVPDDLVADRLDSGAYALALQIDKDGGTALLSAATATNVAQLTKDNIYSYIVGLRKDMNKANIPSSGRYLLITPDCAELVLNSPQFISASSLGDSVKQSGAVGRIAGFDVYEWNDTTANLMAIAGHPKFATRCTEWQKPVHLQSLEGSGKFIGASAVQGRMVYGHKVLRSAAIRAMYSPGSLVMSASQGATSGTIKITVTAGNTGTTYAYKKNPSERASFNETNTAYAGTTLASGTTEIEASAGDIIEVVNLSSNKVVAAGYLTVAAGDIKA